MSRLFFLFAAPEWHMEFSDSARLGSSTRLAEEAAMPLKVIIFYEAVGGAAKAAGVVNRLAKRFGSELTVEKFLWSFDVLRLDQVAKSAQAQTAEADVLIVAAGPDAPLPQHLRDCIERALVLRGERNLAIVAVIDGLPVPDSRASVYLRALCRNEGDEFFWTNDLPLDRSSCSVALGGAQQVPR